MSIRALCSSGTSTNMIQPWRSKPWRRNRSLVTSRLTEIEVRRNLARLLDGTSHKARRRLADDLDVFALVSLDADTCSEAALIAEQTLCRTLDSIHLAAARRAGSSTALLTFDLRQARVARQLGMTVLGV